MTRLIGIFSFIILLSSCTQIIEKENLNVKINSEIYLPKDNNLLNFYEKENLEYYSSSEFSTRYKILLNGNFNNNTGQILEKIIFKPEIKLKYKDDLDYNIKLDSVVKFSTIDLGSEFNLNQEFELNSSSNFYKSILKHEIKNGQLILKIYGMNSLGYDSRKTDSIIIKKNITNEWSKIKSFESSKNFSEPEEVISNYLPQLSLFMNDFIEWEIKKLDEHVKILNTNDFDPWTLVIKNHVIENFDEYQRKLFSTFWDNLEKVDASFVEKNDKSWNHFRSEFNAMFNKREKMEALIFEYRAGGFKKKPEELRKEYLKLKDEYLINKNQSMDYNRDVINNLIEKYPNIE